ncbi:uncharacterized protein LOC125512487 [Triticum urartu]|uniref:uncharacterized protein LOC125512487 n=1 Tax=Triticum urartu TaxID=4572 RepID=UPI002044AACF|nr:uncharacterized protein LOC125512487 [Triticum urartu]
MAPLHKFGLAQETFTLKVMLNAYGASAASTRSAALAAMDRRETLNYERVGSSGVPGEHEDDVCVAGREGDHCRRDDVEVLHEHTHTHQDRVPEVLGHRPLGDVHGALIRTHGTLQRHSRGRGGFCDFHARPIQSARHHAHNKIMGDRVFAKALCR